jgi:dephospho-CoA kinase
MLSIGLTGNIAAGKSTVVDLFRRWGAVVIDADELVREAQAPGTPVFDAIARRFGPEVVAADGTLDRGRLRTLVLANPAALADLNAIVHPEVQRRRLSRLAQARAGGARIVVNDIPLLFEAADPSEFDAIVLVDAPESVRFERLVRLRGLDPPAARGLIDAQMPAAAKRSRSDYVIDNSGDITALEHSAAEVWRALLRRA